MDFKQKIILWTILIVVVLILVAIVVSKLIGWAILPVFIILIVYGAYRYLRKKFFKY